MGEGSALIDNGHLLVSETDASAISSQYPFAKKWVRPLLNGDEFINGRQKFALWLEAASPTELRQCPPVMERVELVKEFRKASNREATKQLSATPTLFGEVRQPRQKYLFVPKTSSEKRQFIPIGFVEPEVLVNNTSLFVDQATLFHFGVLTSTMHNAWVRNTCGRMKSDIRYSKDIVYNNYPWPDLPTSPAPGTPAHKAKAAIEAAAQGVLDARAQFQQGRAAFVAG
jgi:hypothetical protein